MAYSDTLEERRKKYASGLIIRVVVSLLFCLVLLATALLAEPGSAPHFGVAIALLIFLALVNGPLWLIGARCHFPLVHFYWHWLLDLAVITGVLHLLGGAELPYGGVGYMIMILTSAVFLSAKASLIVATGSLAFFNGMILGEWFQVIPSYPDIWAHEYSPPVIVLMVLASDVFFYVFAYLAGSLAEALRSTNEELATARDAASDYNVQLERRVQERTRMLERQNRDIQEFIHVITHDLRNVVIASAEIARLLVVGENDRLSSKGRRYAGHLLQDTRTMGQMLSGLLALFRVERSEGQPEVVSVGSLFDEVVVMHRSSIDSAGASVECREMPDITVDKDELRHVLSNLLDNALKYRSESQRPRVVFEHSRTETEDQFVLIDNGRGVDGADVTKIFELYHRGAMPSGRSGDGLGIGLAMVKKIVDKWNGRVWVESAVGEGSRFGFSVPRSM